MDKKRLDLSFRPDDVFAKPITGELKPTSGLLLKVTKRRRKVISTPSKADEPVASTSTATEPSDTSEINEEPEVEIVGVVRQMFKFEGLCDFQYLAMAKHPSTKKTEFIYDDIMPKSLVSIDWLT